MTTPKINLPHVPARPRPHVVPFGVRDWYFQGPLGLFGTKRNGLVATPATDADYQAWLKNHPRLAGSPWPKDAQGNQSVAAIDEVLKTHRLPVSGLTEKKS